MKVNFLKDVPIRHKLISMNFFIIGILCVGVLIAYEQIALLFESTVNDYCVQIVGQINSKVDYYVDEMNKLYLLINSNEEIQAPAISGDGDPRLKLLDKYRNVTQYLTNLKTFQNFPCDIYYYGSAEESYTTSSLQLANVDGIRQLPWMVEMMKSDSVKSIVTIDKLSQRNYLYFAKKVYSVDSKKAIGVVVIESPISIIENEINQVNLGENAVILISDSDNAVLYTSPSDREESMVQKINGLSGQTRTKIMVGGENYLVSSSSSERTGWKLTGAVPVRQLLTNFNKVRDVAIVLLIICLIITLVASGVISYTISKPIQKLRKLMKKAETGDFSAAFLEDRKDEIGQLGASFNVMLGEINQLISQVYEVRIKQHEAEFSALQAQINPHFLYNTFQSISMEALINGDMTVVEMIGVLVNYLRYNLRRGEEVVKISEEMEHLKNYIRILTFRFKDRFHIVIRVDEELYNCKIIKLCLQPLVENSIQHGFESKKEGGTIEITASRSGGVVSVQVTDDGVGMDEATARRVRREMEETDEAAPAGYGSIGLRNVHQRVRLYFGEEYGIRFESTPGQGTRMELRFPVVEEENTDV